MTDRPLWQQYISWSKPRALIELINNKEDIPAVPGFYVFNEDAGERRPGAVLYIGEPAAKDGLRGRLRPYLTPNP